MTGQFRSPIAQLPLLNLVILLSVFFSYGQDNSLRAATISVPAGGDLYAALNSAQCGDTVILDAGATFVVSGLEQPFVLKKNTACTGGPSEWITVQGSNAASLPVTFKNLSPAQLRALNLPRLVTNTSTPALEAVAEAHHYRVIGLEITNDSRSQSVINNGLVFAGIRHGSSPIVTLQTVPHHIEFDRVWVHSEEDGTDSTVATALRGFMLGAADITIKNSRVAGFRAFAPGTLSPQSTQAVLIEKGPGPYTIHNSFLEAWFTSIFTGGGPQWITNQASVSNASLGQATLSNVNNLIVGDYVAFKVSGQTSRYQVARITGIVGTTITYVGQPGLPNADDPSQVTGNPLVVAPDVPGDAVWNGDTPKNLRITNNIFWKNSVVGAAVGAFGFFGKGHIEFKTATDTLVEGNDFSGFAAGFTITSRNQSDVTTSGNNPWATIRNMTFRNNRWSANSAQTSGAVIGIQLSDNQNTTVRGQNVLFENNLFENLGAPLITFAGSSGVVFRHNTAVGGTATVAVPVIHGHGLNDGFRLEDNILQNNEYGLVCALGTFPACYTNFGATGNVIVDNRSAATKISNGPLSNFYPPGNFYPNTIAEIGFSGSGGLGWDLLPSSPYKGRASGGTDPGVNMQVLLSALGGSIAPTPTPTPAPSPSPTPTPTPPPPTSTLRIITISGDGTGPAVALNAARETGPSFDVETITNFGSDKRTRVHIFANGVSVLAVNSNPTNDFLVQGIWLPNLAESVRVEAELRDGRKFNLPVEVAGSAWSLPGLDQVDIILVPELRGVGVVELTLVVAGQRSNIGTIYVR